MNRVTVIDANNYPVEVVERYIKLFLLIYQSKDTCNISLEVFNQMITERLTQRENLVIRLIHGLGYCCEECWKDGYIPKQQQDGETKSNEKVIPSKVNPMEYFKPHSRNSVAEIFGIHPEGIRTAQKNAIKKLRHPGTLQLIKGDKVDHSLYVPNFGYIRREYLKYPAYLYIKHGNDFQLFVEALESMNLDIHIPIARQTEKSKNRLVCDLFNPKLTKALEQEGGCYSLNDLAKKSGFEILCIKGVGYHSYTAIVEKLKENEFEFL